MKTQVLLFMALLFFSSSVKSQSNDEAIVLKTATAPFKTDTIKVKESIGVAIDLLPPILSATTGHFGYSAQVWYGYNKNRIRGVVAGFQIPDKIMGNDSFKDLKTTATALIYDRFKNNNFQGWWLGAGLEFWNNTITSNTDYKDYNFNNYVATTGMGYIFTVYKNSYIEPWGAIHYVLNDEKVVVGNTEYQTKKFQGEVSLKIGWAFKL
jgi:hypothetical protein